MYSISLWIAIGSALVQLPQQKPQWARIRLEHARPSDLLRHLEGGEWWLECPPPKRTAKEVVGVETLLAYDVDDTMIVRGSPSQIEKARSLLRSLDIPSRQVKIVFAATMTAKDGVTKEAKVPRSSKAQRFPHEDVVWRSLPRTPQSGSEDDPLGTFVAWVLSPEANPTTGTIPVQPGTCAIWVHGEDDVRVALRLLFYWEDTAGTMHKIERIARHVSFGSQQVWKIPFTEAEHPVDFYTVEVTASPMKEAPATSKPGGDK